MTDTMLCIRGGEVRAMAVVADDEIYREVIAEWIADPATEAILKVDVETARTAFLRPAADLIMAKLVRAVEAVGQRTPPPPQTHVVGDFLKPSTTARGFRLLTFTDAYGTECTLQESSLATEAAIWLGAAKLEVKRFPGNCTGWHDVDFTSLLPGQDISGNERMHLTQDQVRFLLPALQHFAETGELPTDPSPQPREAPDASG